MKQLEKNTLKVTGIEVRKSEKAGCDFKVVTFGVFDEKNRKVGSGTRNFWPTHKATGADGKEYSIKGDQDYDILQKGDLYVGDLFVTRTTDYRIGDNTANSWKGIVFSTENALVVAAQALRQNSGYPIDEETDEVFTLQNRSAAPAASKPAMSAAELPA